MLLVCCLLVVGLFGGRVMLWLVVRLVGVVVMGFFVGGVFEILGVLLGGGRVIVDVVIGGKIVEVWFLVCRVLF